MKTVGIICEYNPFHKGHEYQIAQAKEKTGADCVICVMSGNFVQRGDIAISDKFTRAKSAVLCGADLVVELPCVYALSCAEKFAFGGVSILNALGVDYISFGAECGDIKKLENLADILSNETANFKKLLSDKLKSGISYQKAREEALYELYDEDFSPISKPNNALAIEYLKAIKKLCSKMTPVLIKRTGSSYNSKKLEKNKFASARGIREFIKSNGFCEELSEFIPQPALDIYRDSLSNGTNPVFLSALDNIILYRLRTITKEDLAQINDVSEGLENRIIESAKKCSTTEELINLCSGKRYTKNRIARIILCALFGIKKTDLKDPDYVRVLAMTKTGAKVLSNLKKTCPLPIITKLAKYDGNSDILKFDILAGDIYSLVFSDNKEAGSDYKTSPTVACKDEINYVYIIRCADNSLYTGWTNNLEKRFSDHNSGKGAKYTKGRGPLELVYYEEFKNKSDALRREHEIKQFKREEKEKLIKNFLN